jgi:hypothetical protein
MHPSKITEIRAKVYGGAMRGALLTTNPTSLQDVEQFFREANDFLNIGDARMLEITVLNQREGLKEVRNLYAQQALVKDVWTDPYVKSRLI